jgi:hypothetical protein
MENPCSRSSRNLRIHSTRTTRNDMRDRFLPRLRAVAERISTLLV